MKLTIKTLLKFAIKACMLLGSLVHNLEDGCVFRGHFKGLFVHKNGIWVCLLGCHNACNKTINTRKQACLRLDPCMSCTCWIYGNDPKAIINKNPSLCCPKSDAKMDSFILRLPTSSSMDESRHMLQGCATMPQVT